MSKHRSKTLWTLLAVLCIVTGCATTRPDSMTSVNDTQTAESSTVSMRYYPGNYRRMGITAADNDYTVAEPFATGLLLGMISPVASAVSAHQADSAIGSGGGIAGVTTMTLTIWGGKKLVDVYPVPVPDRHVTGFEQDKRDAFTYAYTERIKEKRSAGYSAGVLTGIFADVIFVLWVISKLHAIDFSPGA